MNRYSAELSFAIDLAYAASREILARFPPTAVETKPDGTPLTQADRSAEAVMRKMIRAAYPAHGILGEEEGEILGDGEHQWLLDPLDGTSSFALGLPNFGTLAALLKRGYPLLGVVHLPVTSETLFAERGAGC